MLEPEYYVRPKDHWRIMFQGKAQKTHCEGYWEGSHERDPSITQKSWPGVTVGELAMEFNIWIAMGTMHQSNRSPVANLKSPKQGQR